MLPTGVSGREYGGGCAFEAGGVPDDPCFAFFLFEIRNLAFTDELILRANKFHTAGFDVLHYRTIVQKERVIDKEHRMRSNFNTFISQKIRKFSLHSLCLANAITPALIGKPAVTIDFCHVMYEAESIFLLG